ncbi:dihydrofolate reductase family protein [Actinoplanes sp. CA-030573]|uniref:dihydrofolate reductase family protein n=1 Tax=Actinoplanes sp. CA-030573 TaxID=3239898 RepID=UPI003D929342
MAKVLYSATMSLDGFIAGPGGDMSWLADHLGPNETADRIVEKIGAILVGRRTFEGDDPNKGTDKEGAFEGAWHGPQFVLTHRPPDEPVPGTTFVTDLAEGVALAKDAAGDKYVNILGADVARQALQAGFVDEILVFVAPVLLGDGTRLFEVTGGANIRLDRLSQSESPMATGIWYAVAGT